MEITIHGMKVGNLKMLRNTIPLILSLLIISSCSTNQRINSYKTLTISKSTYNSTMLVASDLYKQGKITENTKSLIIQSGNAYRAAHNAAVSALLKFNNSENLSDQKKYLNNLSNASNYLADMIDIIEPYMDRSKDE